MAKMKQRDLGRILAVTEPGMATDSGIISDAIFNRFGVRYTKREIGLAISWQLNTSFKKERDSQRRYTFTKLHNPVGGDGPAITLGDAVAILGVNF